MNIVHETIVRPQKGVEQEVAGLLDQLGEVVSREHGFVEGYTLDGLAEGGLLARISVWESRADSERSSGLEQAMALRARIRLLCHPTDQELVDIISERPASVGELVPA